MRNRPWKLVPVISPFLAAAILLHLPLGHPLWPGARYTHEDRHSAVLRGLHFLGEVARNPRSFAANGADLIWCFYSTSEAAADPVIRRIARGMALEGAQRWRRQNPHVPEKASADDVADFAYGGYTADSLGFRDTGFREEVRRAAECFRPEDFLLFDPVRESVPTDLPARCKRCGSNNPRGRRTCRTCGTALRMLNPYDILLDALLDTYFGDLYGVRLGAHFADVARWIPALRPYPGQHGAGNASFYSVAYAITHIVYTFNGYSRYRLRKEWFPEEYRFLESHFRRNLAARDVETTGEFMDTLRSFGLSESDGLIREGIEFLLDRQNADGSWGDPGERDIYVRYHTTWTAIDGLMDYAWQGEQVSFPGAFQRIRRP